MLRLVKNIFLQALHRRGWVLTHIEKSEYAMFANLLSRLGAQAVADVGANIGQFGMLLRKGGFNGKIYSFEPQVNAHASLLKAADGDANWHVMPRMAVGREKRQSEIFVSENSVSSSLLTTNQELLANEKGAQVLRAEPVMIERLDEQKQLWEHEKLFLKVDTQGFEEEVLAGATGLMANVVGVHVEASIAGLWKEQGDWREISKSLEAQGFVLWHVQSAFENRDTWQTLQLDLTFIRRDAMTG